MRLLLWEVFPEPLRTCQVPLLFFPQQPGTPFLALTLHYYSCLFICMVGEKHFPFKQEQNKATGEIKQFLSGKVGLCLGHT